MATPRSDPGGGRLSAIERSGNAGCMTIEMTAPAPAPPVTETGELPEFPDARAEIPTGERCGSDYAVLSKRIAAAGLLRRRTGYYVARTIVVAAMLIGSWVAIAVLGSSWWVLALAPVMAIVFAQIASALPRHRAPAGVPDPARRARSPVGSLETPGWA